MVWFLIWEVDKNEMVMKNNIPVFPQSVGQCQDKVTGIIINSKQ